MEYKEFGSRIRELRRQSNLSQRELADMVGINYTYLSKIESGAMPPPSEKVIIKIAEVLNADKDELITLAGRIPSDIAQLLKDRDIMKSLRKAQSKKTEKARRTGILTRYKPVYRVATAFLLVIAIATSLWFAAPTSVKALDIDFTNPSTGTTGSPYSFSVNITINDSELLPIKRIDLRIYNVDNPSLYYDRYTGLSLASTLDYVTYSTTGTGVSANIKTTAASNWASSYGYGYGYVTYNSTPSYFGYGYGYGYGSGSTSIKYDIDWTPPSGWQGSYKIEAKITAQDDSEFPNTTNTFTLSAPVTGGGGGGGGGGGSLPAGVTNVADYVTSQGVFRSEVTAYSADKNLALTIPKDTIGLTSSGLRLSRITILKVDTPPAPPEGTIAVGLVYDLDPDGTTFTPPAILTINYDPASITSGYSEDTLAIAIYDEDTGAWTVLEGCILDAVNHTISVPLSHFTYATIVAYPSPAEFTTGMLTISPTKVEIGESVSISTVITNTGLQEGTYSVTLRIDNAVITTKEVTLAGGESGTITFTTSRDVAGTYNVNVNGKTGTFTVKEPVLPPELVPATFNVTGLIIYPADVEIGESVTIRISVINSGDLSGTYTATLKINNIVESTKEVTLDGGTSETITFTTSRDTAGTYTIDIDDQSDTFTVRTVPEPPAKEINWWLIGGIIAGVIAVSIIVWLVIMHRRLEGYS